MLPNGQENRYNTGKGSVKSNTGFFHPSYLSQYKESIADKKTGKQDQGLSAAIKGLTASLDADRISRMKAGRTYYTPDDEADNSKRGGSKKLQESVDRFSNIVQDNERKTSKIMSRIEKTIGTFEKAAITTAKVVSKPPAWVGKQIASSQQGQQADQGWQDTKHAGRSQAVNALFSLNPLLAPLAAGVAMRGMHHGGNVLNKLKDWRNNRKMNVKHNGGFIIAHGGAIIQDKSGNPRGLKRGEVPTILKEGETVLPTQKKDFMKNLSTNIAEAVVAAEARNMESWNGDTKPGALRSIFSNPVPSWAGKYKSDLPKVGRLGILASIYRVSALNFLQSKLSFTKMHELIKQQSEMQMKAFGVKGTLDKPKGVRRTTGYTGATTTPPFKSGSLYERETSKVKDILSRDRGGKGGFWGGGLFRLDAKRKNDSYDPELYRTFKKALEDADIGGFGGGGSGGGKMSLKKGFRVRNYIGEFGGIIGKVLNNRDKEQSKEGQINKLANSLHEKQPYFKTMAKAKSNWKKGITYYRNFKYGDEEDESGMGGGSRGGGEERNKGGIGSDPDVAKRLDVMIKLQAETTKGIFGMSKDSAYATKVKKKEEKRAIWERMFGKKEKGGSKGIGASIGLLGFSSLAGLILPVLTTALFGSGTSAILNSGKGTVIGAIAGALLGIPGGMPGMLLGTAAGSMIGGMLGGFKPKEFNQIVDTYRVRSKGAMYGAIIGGSLGLMFGPLGFAAGVGIGSFLGSKIGRAHV